MGDDDGRIHWTQFRDHINNTLGLNIDEKKLRIIFDDIDTDKDEYITRDQYKTWMEKLNSLHLQVLLKGMSEYVETEAKSWTFSFNQAGVNYLYQTLQSLNFNSLDGTYDGFKGYLVGLGRNIPNMVVDKIWKAMNPYGSSTVSNNDYQQYVKQLTAEKLKNTILGN